MMRRLAILLVLALSTMCVAQKRQRVRHPRRGTREHYLWTAECRDGTHTFAKRRLGACSYHGGVKHWIVKPVVSGQW